MDEKAIKPRWFTRSTNSSYVFRIIFSIPFLQPLLKYFNPCSRRVVPMLLIKIGKEIQRFAGHIGTLPAMLKTLALATGRYLANTIEWMTVSGDTTPAIAWFSVLTFTADQTASGLNHDHNLLIFFLSRFYHHEHDNYLSCS